MDIFCSFHAILKIISYIDFGPKSTFFKVLNQNPPFRKIIITSFPIELLHLDLEKANISHLATTYEKMKVLAVQEVPKKA